MRVEKINSQQNFKGLYVKPSASKKLESLFEKLRQHLNEELNAQKLLEQCKIE